MRRRYLQQDEELEHPPEGGREQPRVCHRHLEEQRVEEAVADVDERVLVDVGVPQPVVVQRNVVPGALVLRHLGIP